MKRFLYEILSLWLSFTFTSSLPFMINVIGENNGKGWEADLTILTAALTNLGHTVYQKQFSKQAPNNKNSKADINIFVSSINGSYLGMASHNWFIPNPEIKGYSKQELGRIDCILCRTRESERIFKKAGKQTFYLGFTSYDCSVPGIEKDFSQCFHLAGSSPWKGTSAVLNAWEDESTLPQLVGLIQQTNPLYSSIFLKAKTVGVNFEWLIERVAMNELRQFQNRSGIHLCTSSVEGYGHYLVEAMSAGAVVVTTDAPPMNEFVTDKRCLVPYSKKGVMHLAGTYDINELELKKKIQALMSLSEEELREIGVANRRRYLEMKAEFYENLELLFTVQ